MADEAWLRKNIRIPRSFAVYRMKGHCHQRALLFQLPATARYQTTPSRGVKHNLKVRCRNKHTTAVPPDLPVVVGRYQRAGAD